MSLTWLLVLTIYSIAMIVFFVAFVGDAIRFRREIVGLWRWGFAAGAVLLCMGVIILVPLMPRLTSSSRQLGLLLGMDLRVTLFVAMGIYYCRRMAIPAFSLSKRLYRLTETTAHAPLESQPAWDDPANSISVDDQTSMGAPAPCELPAADGGLVGGNDTPDAPVAAHVNEDVAESTVSSPMDGRLKKVGLALAVGMGAVLYTEVLFWITRPDMSAFLRSMAERVGGQNSNVSSTSAIILLAFLEFAFREELVFRLGIQNYLARVMTKRGLEYWWAIAATSLVWTLGHAGMVDPNWVKMLQIFSIGLAFGWLFRKCGIEACIIAHAVLNLVVPFMPYAQQMR